MFFIEDLGRGGMPINHSLRGQPTREIGFRAIAG
jgi:hypothetical protein